MMPSKELFPGRGRAARGARRRPAGRRPIDGRGWQKCFSGGERLEGRAMLAVTPYVVGTDLQIDVTDSDTAYVRLDPSGLSIEVAADSAFTVDYAAFPAAGISTITVEGETAQSEGLSLTSGLLDVALTATEVERITFDAGAGVTGDVDASNATAGLTVDGLLSDAASFSSSVAGISLSGVVSVAGRFELLAAGDVAGSAAAVTAASVIVSIDGISGDVLLDNPANTIGAFAASNQNVANGVISVAADGMLQLGVSLTAGEDGIFAAEDGSIAIVAASGVMQLASSALSGGSLTVTADAGDIVLTEQENNVGAFAATSTATGAAIRLAATGDLVIGVGTTGIDSDAAVIEIEAYGSITQVAEIVGDSLSVAQLLSTTDGEEIDLSNTSNAINTLTASNASLGGDVTFANGLPLRIHDPASDADPTLVDVGIDTNDGCIVVTADGPIAVLGTLDYREACLTLTDTNATPGSVSFLVINEDDGGSGSLRNRLQNVHDNQAASQLQTVLFRADVDSIELLTPLADITRQVAIDGEGRPVEILGTRITESPSSGFAFAAGSQGSLLNSLSIGGFATAGVRIGASSITVTGCFIGVAADGTSRPNGIGVLVTNGAQGAAIGQPTLGNVIAASTSHGISFESDSSGTVVGNTIGLDLDGNELANGGAGVSIVDAGGVTVGGGTEDDRNVISGNIGDGIAISGASGATVIEGNWVGVSTDGLSGIGNGGVGVRVTGTNASVRIGSEAGGGNVISANGGDGILIEMSSATEILGNMIGLDADGAEAIGNEGAGVAVTEFASSTVVGRLGSANVISGNAGAGVYVSPTASDTSITGNTIGLDQRGTEAVGNGADGIFIDGATSTSVVSNVVSGNGGNGVRVIGQSATATAITGNLVGLTAGGDAEAGNAAVGIRITDVPGIVVGGGSAAERNVVSGNGAHGILIFSDVIDGAVGSRVSSNYVGTDVGGAVAIPNAGDGVRVEGIGAAGATVVGNLVSGNEGAGIRVTGDATGSRVAGNIVGLDAGATAAVGNVGDGVRIEGGASHFVGGEIADQNVVSGNGASGIVVVAASETLVATNIAGTNAFGEAGLGNGGDGIAILGAANTVIRGNVASGNSGSGVSVSASDDETPASGTTIVGNLLGTGPTGVSGLANQQHGVVIRQASGTTVGGTSSADRNVISGNVGTGVHIESASETEVSGNFIGVTASGYSALGNQAGGVLVSGATATTIAGGNVIAFNGSDASGHGVKVSGGDGTVVGDQDAGLGNGNAIYRNAGDGIRIDGAATGTVVVGNSIGAPASGAVGFGNEGAGVVIVGTNGSTIGGLRSARGGPLGNQIIGNGGGGVAIVDALPASTLGEEGNVVQGNVIRRNRGAGVSIETSAFQVIGGDAATLGNEIGQNSGDGIRIDNTSGAEGHHIVAGNAIGTDATGSQRLGNAGDGVAVVASIGNVIGGVDGEGNVIAYNRSGVVLTGVAAAGAEDGNVVAGNTITANVANGVRLEASSLNTIGSTASLPGNVITLNGGAGVWIAGGSDGNLVSDNFIGTDASDQVKSNARQGVLITASEQNEVLGNTIAWNRLGGVRVAGGGGNVIGGADLDSNVIRTNGGPGVMLAAGSVGNYVRGNLVRGNTAGGISVSASGNNRVDGGNVVVKNQKFGISVSGGVGNVVDGNFVGTNASSVISRGNMGPGIVVTGGTATLVGGSTGNTVRFNAGDGIQLVNVSAASADKGSTVSYNTSSSNTGNGLSISGGALAAVTGNLFGGLAAGAGNARSGFAILGGASGTTITGNVVDGNAVSGGELDGAVFTVIGGDGTDANLFTGNRGDGLRLSGRTVGTAIGGNTIAGNGGDGIEINASIGNSVGAATITGNRGAGIAIVSAKAGSSSDGNTVSGAVIAGSAVGISVLGSAGTSVTDGTSVSGSLGAGILVGEKSTQTLIDGATIAGSRGAGVEINASRSTVVRGTSVSGGAGSGILLSQASGVSAADANVLSGNEIHGNSGNGITLVASSFNTIGGGSGNTIRGNRGHGIVIRQASSANTVTGNTIGLDAEGNAEGNALDGIRIAGSLGNVVGQGNLIAANRGAGVSILDAFAATSAAGNRVEASTIEGNLGAGVALNGGAHVVGGASGNTITGNGGGGVVITASSGVTKIAGPTIAGNMITDNGGSGVSLTGVAGARVSGNAIGGHAVSGVALIGGTGNWVTSNVIGSEFGANLTGVALSAGASQNVVVGNTISANEGDGIAISGGRSSDNLVGVRSAGLGESGVANAVFANFGAGIRVARGVRNQVAGNSIYGNVEGGIVLQEGGNSMQPAPSLTSARRVVVAGRTQVQVTGEVRGAPRQRIVVDFFRNDAADGNPATRTGYQSRTAIGRVTVVLDASGKGTFTAMLAAVVPAGDWLTAVATTASGVVGNASQQSAVAVPV